VGTDNDPVAVELAKECMAENGLSGVELSTKTLDQVDGAFDLVLANILANTLIELAPLIAPKVKHRLVLAGVLAPQADEVKAAFSAQGLVHAGDEFIGEWIRIDFDAPR
jgi:ribosomal protein L11 methyltransferase